MKDRPEIKLQAKQNFHSQYGICILAIVLLILANPITLFFSIYNFIHSIGQVAYIRMIGSIDAISTPGSGGSLLALVTSSLESFNLFQKYGPKIFNLQFFLLQAPILFTIFVIAPMRVGYNRFSLRVYRGEQGVIKEIFSQGFKNYWRKVGGMLWMDLFILLWSLLLIIPGFIKMLAYSMTPYILADSKNVTAREALELSICMTDGYKGDIFIMGLSFIGWNLLSGLTFGLLGVFYVYPYIETSFAGLYEELKQKALVDGTVTAEELA